MFYKYPSFTTFKKIFNNSLASVMHFFLTNLSQQSLHKLATKEVFTVD